MQKNFEIITSRKNAAVLAAAALSEKKQRDKTGLFAFEGIKLFLDALGAGLEIEKVFVTERAYERYCEELAPAMAKLTVVTDEVYEKLSKSFMVDFDETGSIGKRYRREDEIGTPFCITYDFDSETDGCVTVRDRDTMEQVRLPIDELEAYIASKIEF